MYDDNKNVNNDDDDDYNDIVIYFKKMSISYIYDESGERGEY